MTNEHELFAAVRSGNADRVREILKADPAAVHERDDDGATPLHYAAEISNRDIVYALLDAGADINARDLKFNATPCGWAIEYLRARGGLLGIEIEDAAYAIRRGDAELLERYLTRFPGLRDATDKHGTPLRAIAIDSANPAIERQFSE